MEKGWKIKMILLVAVGTIVLAATVMLLWNWLVPVLFNGSRIDLLQALGLMLLSRILFRGIQGDKCRGRYYYESIKNWKGRFKNMSPEEREKMRDLWKKRCGGYDCDEDNKDSAN